ncbi:hypothetical protein [Neorhizobium sp. NCHU2750]|uniref:hypothetical protein n=1 Tax=Neorhizobium sp. NCHU2750 TaxID=1825976 RepID=UPI000EB7317A|nr:hypothetical protein NCHU2750_23640 [Neorhizobium sp. NCHU2750]
MTPNVRQAMFPYGMAKNPDGSWTFFNRKYKTLGTVTKEHSEWNDAKHKMFLTGLGPAKRKKLDIHGVGDGDRIYFYNDATIPTSSDANMKAYLAKLRLLMSLESKEP